MGNTDAFVIVCEHLKFIFTDHLGPKPKRENLCNTFINILAFTTARNSLR